MEGAESPAMGWSLMPIDAVNAVEVRTAAVVEFKLPSTAVELDEEVCVMVIVFPVMFAEAGKIDVCGVHTNTLASDGLLSVSGDWTIGNPPSLKSEGKPVRSIPPAPVLLEA
jgi:hypothetical protein